MSEDFVAECENMNISSLLKKQYIVSVSTGDRDQCKLLASTIHGPYDFLGMVEAVGTMWEKQQHHSKVTVLETDTNKATRFLNEDTTDYIEAKWQTIITNGTILGDFNAGGEDYTCKAVAITGREEATKQYIEALKEAMKAQSLEVDEDELKKLGIDPEKAVTKEDITKIKQYVENREKSSSKDKDETS